MLSHFNRMSPHDKSPISPQIHTIQHMYFYIMKVSLSPSQFLLSSLAYFATLWSGETQLLAFHKHRQILISHSVNERNSVITHIRMYS